MKIFLDDFKKAPIGWIHTNTTEETIRLLGNYHVDAISLDHDLGDNTKGNGYDVLCWIEEHVVYNNYTPPKIYLHTENPSARIKMQKAIEKIKSLYKKDGYD